jgi:branched-chain amino acid transport system permease protein
VTGQLSLGHAGFLAVGAFAAASLLNEMLVPFPFVLSVALLLGGAVGIAVGLPALRLRGIYLAMSTLAAQFVIVSLATHYQTAFGSSSGFLIEPPTIGLWTVHGESEWYLVLAGFAATSVAVGNRLLRSHVGRAWWSIKEHPAAASALGIDVRRYRLLAFALYGAMTGLAGALLAYYTGFVSVEAFSFLVTVQYLAMIVVGGLGSVAGSVYGAIVVTILPFAVERIMEQLLGRGTVANRVFAAQAAAFGVLLYFFLAFQPGGLVSLWSRIRRTPALESDVETI